MTRVVYYVASSLDGYIARPDGSVNWLDDFQSSTQDYGYADFYASIDALVMGRRTYDQVRGFGDWPYPGKPCRVITSGSLADAPPGVAAAPDPAVAMASLGIDRLWLVGGTTLFHSMREAGLVDEYVVTVMPLLLGDGVPLFRPGTGKRLRLAECQSFPDGVVQMRYQVADA